MEIENEILHKLGRIEGQLIVVPKLVERVTALENTQAWLKGGWLVMLGAFASMLKGIFGK